MSTQKERNVIEDDATECIQNTFRLEKKNNAIDERMESYIKDLSEPDRKNYYEPTRIYNAFNNNHI